MVCNQRRFAAQEAFLVGIENRDQRDFGQIEPFAEQVHADQAFEMAGAQIAQQFDALEGVEFAVQPFAFDALLGQIERQIFGQAFGQRRDQHAFADGGPLFDLFQQMRHLPAGRVDFDHRIQAGRSGG